MILTKNQAELLACALDFYSEEISLMSFSEDDQRDFEVVRSQFVEAIESGKFEVIIRTAIASEIKSRIEQ